LGVRAAKVLIISAEVWQIDVGDQLGPGEWRDGREGRTGRAPAKCLEAVVNPVTGYAFCVNPRGAPVEPPPRASLNRPCKPRVHDNDAFTVYEHWSGC
jgi:hypothetical protein